MMDGWMHSQTDEDHFYSLSPTSGEKKSHLNFFFSKTVLAHKMSRKNPVNEGFASNLTL